MIQGQKPSNNAKVKTSAQRAGGTGTSKRRGGTPSLDFARAQLQAALCHPDAHQEIPALDCPKAWLATLKERLQLKQEGAAAVSLQTDLLQDEDLCDQILQKIAADVDTYAGKIVSNVDLWYGG